MHDEKPKSLPPLEPPTSEPPIPESAQAVKTPTTSPSESAPEHKATEHNVLPQPSTPIWKIKKPLWPMIMLVMLVIAGFTGWKIYQGLRQPSASEPVETTNRQARLPVRVTRAQSGLAQAWVFDEGISLPVQLRVLNFYADGDITYVDKINGVALKEGDFVSQGQLLATVDDRRQASSLVTSEADIQVATNERDQSQASVLKAKADLAKRKSEK